MKIEIDTRRGGRREKGAHLLVRVVHPRDAEERGGEEGGKSHETKEFEQPSDPERRESERTGGQPRRMERRERHARNDGSRVNART